MQLKHRVRINVQDQNHGEKIILEAANRKLPIRLLKRLFGDFTTVYLLSPGQSVKSVEIHEIKEVNENEHN